MLLDEDKVTCIQDEPITHTIDVAFFVQPKEVFDYIKGNHLVEQLVCLAKERFSINEWSFNLPKLEHIQYYDVVRVDGFLSNLPSDNANLTLERLMVIILDSFWEDFVKQE